MKCPNNYGKSYVDTQEQLIHHICGLYLIVIMKTIYRDVKNTILATRNRKQFRILLSLWIT